MNTVVCCSTYSLIDGSVIGRNDLITVVLAWWEFCEDFSSFQTLKFRVTEFRFICWLVEMRWVGTFKPHLILSNLLIVVIQLTFMEFSSWHPIKTPLISFGPFETYRICYCTSQRWSTDRRCRFRQWSRDQPIPGPPKGSKIPHELS